MDQRVGLKGNLKTHLTELKGKHNVKNFEQNSQSSITEKFIALNVYVRREVSNQQSKFPPQESRKRNAN